MRIDSALIISSLLQLTVAAGIALGNTITYSAPTATDPGKFSGELPIARIANVLLPEGLVNFSGDEVTVSAVPDWLFDHDTVLKGALVRAELQPAKGTSVVSGLVFFYEGQWLANLGPIRAIDVIDTNGGEQVRGRIVSRIGQAFAVQPNTGGVRKINFSDIKSISSPRAFTFNMQTPTTRLAPTDSSLSFDASNINFASSSLNGKVARKATLPQSNLPGSDKGIKNNELGTFIALDVLNEIAPAIVIPLVLNPSTQSAALNQISRTDAAAGLYDGKH
jgi:hypothetical protein